MPKSFARTPQHFSDQQLSPARVLYQDSLDAIPNGYSFSVAVTCDAEIFYQFMQQCRASRCRPPSALAYLARCLGLTLENRTELLVSRMGRRVFIPTRVDAIIAVEVNTSDGSSIARGLRFEDLANRDLADIAEEMKLRVREAKRTSASSPLVARRFVPVWAPLWWRRLVHKLRERHPAARQRYAQQYACVQLSSTAQWMEGRIGWGMRQYRPQAPSVMLVGQSRRPVVVGDEVVPRFCFDLTFTFDHVLVDGGPATRFIAAFCKEVESGRVLGEYPIVERSRVRNLTVETS